jgi:hypothetical protein
MCGRLPLGISNAASNIVRAGCALAPPKSADKKSLHPADFSFPFTDNIYMMADSLAI